MKSKDGANSDLRAFELSSIEFSYSAKMQAIPGVLNDKIVSKDATVTDKDPDLQLFESKYALLLQ